MLLVLAVAAVLIPALPLPNVFAPTATPVSVAQAEPEVATAPLTADLLPGYYSPNTTIEFRNGGELWFVRPPYQSALMPVGDLTYTFTAGWLTGKVMNFEYNESGGISIMLHQADGSRQEFARSGELYTDLPPELRAALTGVLETTLARHSYAPGMALYVHIPYQGIWMGARGVSSRQDGIPMVPHDRFRIASVSKVFVATVILQLIDEGVLGLDQTVEQWMPGIVGNGDQVTIRQLLTHTSGVPNYLEGRFINDFLNNRGRFWQQQELVAYGTSRPPDFAPGQPERWRYSNTNYVLLGMIVEHATGTSMAQQVRWRIIEPLGLQRTSFEPYEPGLNTVRGYSGNVDLTSLNMSIVWSAGGISSTVEDVGIFADALFSGRLLSPQGMENLHSFVDTRGAWGARHLLYGMGIMEDHMSVGPRLDGQPRPFEHGLVRGHTGSLAGYRTAMWYMPASGITIVAVANQMSFDPNILVTAAMDELLIYRDRTGQQ
jgi:CubicO group peptidase (beta-lactamase class C family)